MSEIFFIISAISGAFTIGLYIGRRLGIQETEHKLHIISGKKAAERFYRITGLDDKI